MLIRNIKKMKKNKWTYIALMFGLILSITCIVIIPMFSRSSLDRLLKDTMKNYTKETSAYPLSIQYKFNYANVDYITGDSISSKKDYALNHMKNFEFPIFMERHILEYRDFAIWEEGLDILNKKVLIETNFDLFTIEFMEDNIELVRGRMVSEKSTDEGVYEVIVDSHTFNSRNLKLDKEYNSYFKKKKEDTFDMFVKEKIPVKFKIVGVYEIKEGDFWTKGQWVPGMYYFITNKYNFKNMLKSQNEIGSISEYFLDYKNIRYSEIDFIDYNINVEEDNKEVIITSNISEIIKNLEDKMKSMQAMMIIIFLPIIFMLGLYTFMISRIIVNNDSNEISLLKSRGAKLQQILSSYIIQGSIMGGIGIIIAPFLSKFIVHIMGATSDFLQFSNRNGLYPYIIPSDYLLAVAVVVIFILTMLLPVYIVSKKSIVETKRDKIRVSKVSLWKKYFIDMILVAFSIYSLFTFTSRKGSISDDVVPIDPITYVIISLMCLGLCMFFLRMYPYAIKFIFRLRKKSWSPESYYMLVNTSRDFSRKEYIMIFLIFTLATGIFNMNSARKMNSDGVDNISYSIGADIVLKEAWETAGEDMPPIESDFEQFKKVDGIDIATKVLKWDSCSLNSGENVERDIRYIGIIPEEFGKISWMRDDLFPEHWYNHLNTLTDNPHGILVSNSLLEKGFKVNDTIKFKMPLTEDPNDDYGYFIECEILGSFNYWPGWNPKETPLLVVGNYNYSYERTCPFHYSVWMNVKDGVTSKNVIKEIEENKIDIDVYVDRAEKLEEFKSDIFVQGLNASYSFAFIMNLIITFTGFLVYWILDIKERTLQFGILRALGVSKRKVYKMIILEQFFSTIISIVIGTIIGTEVFKLFRPIMEMQTIEGNRILPQLMQNVKLNYISMFCAIFIMIVIVVLILIRYISKLKIGQAIRLGED